MSTISTPAEIRYCTICDKPFIYQGSELFYCPSCAKENK